MAFNSLGFGVWGFMYHCCSGFFFSILFLREGLCGPDWLPLHFELTVDLPCSASAM